MRTIDVFVSFPADVRKEYAVAEQLIRFAAAEFDLPINVSYSNPLRGSKAEDASVGCNDFGAESTLVLSPRFWEYPELEGDDFLEQIPNTGGYDLFICILWSRLGTAALQNCVMPDGSRPRSATEYEIAWALDQAKRTPGSPVLRVYRNRATPVAPLEPKEKREHLCRQWDAVQEFCTAFEKTAGTGFSECCHDYQDLEEFENLFREHFRDFLARRLDRGTGSSKVLRKVRYLESNPFRGLNFFDFEHAALFHGRTRAVGEVLDVLKNQAAAKKRFILVLGPSGSGKSSLVRAGVLPLLIRGGTPAGNGPWRYALTRPGAGDPFDTLAAALLTKFALPELQDAASPEDWSSLASQLREDPDGAAVRVAQVLDQLTRQELDHLSDQRKTEGLLATINEGSEAVSPKSQGPVKPKMWLAIVVDQLEGLFTGVSSVLQQEYIAALCALVNCDGVFIFATLRSDFYPHCQRFPELVKLTAFGGRYKLQPLTPRGFGNMIRFPAEAAGLRFERNPETGRSLDEALLKAALASSEPLPLLEHVLSRLYQKQLDRKDGLLRWADYRGLGRLQDALAQHAESVFLTLTHDEQEALKFVIRHLVADRGEEGLLNRRSVPYRDLVSSPKLDERQRAGAKGLVDRLIEEGLLSADTDPRQKLLISIPQEVLLRRWPRLWQSLSEDRLFFQMRDRLDAGLKVWLRRGRQSDDLLDPGIELAEAETLLRDFGSSLSKSQIHYIQKSLARQKRRYRVRKNIGLAAIVGLAIFATFAAIERFNTGSWPNREQGVQSAQQNTELETQLKKTEEKLQLAQRNVNLAASQRSELESELKKTQVEKAQLVQQNTDLANSQQSALETQRNELETQLKKAEEKLQLAQQNVDLANSQRSDLEAELKKAEEEKVQLAEQNTTLGSSQQSALETQRNELETQLKKAEDKLQLEQQNTDLAASQRSELESELKKTQVEKAQLVQQNTDLANSQQSALETQRNELETQLKKAEEKLQAAQQNADLVGSQRSELESELKKAQAEKAQLAQQNTDLANSRQTALETQRSELETQLKKAEEKLQAAQQNADLAASQWSALESEFKKAQVEKAQLVQQNTDLLNNQQRTLETQRNELETQLKKAEDKLQLEQQNTDLAASQRSELESELKKAQVEKAQLVQQNTDLLNSQQSALEAQRRELETQLKKEQDKLQKVQENADRLTSELTESQAQLRQEQERVQKAQANIDSPNGELRGVPVNTSVTSTITGINPEEKRDELQLAEYARFNPPQDVAPTPSPSSTKESETSSPPKSQFGRNAEASGEMALLKKFVLGYLRTVAINDTSTQRRYFADRVNFYGRGVLDSSNVEASTQRYHDEWPIRKWTPRGEAKVVHSRKHNVFVVYQPFRWAVSADSQHADGDATLYLRIRKNSLGEFRIVHVQQLDH